MADAPAAHAAPAAPASGAPDPKGGAAAPPKPGESGKPGDAKPGESAAAAAARKKKYQVDGRDYEVDLSDERTLDVIIQKGLGAEKRFSESAKQRKEAEALLTMLRKNPMAVLEQVTKLQGGDARKVVEDWLWENHVKLEQLTPEQKEAELNKRKLADLEGKEKERLTQEQQEKFEQAKQHYRSHFEKDIIGALETTGLPKTAWTVQRMAHYLLQANKAGLKVSAADVAPLVRGDFEVGFREMFSAANADVLVKIVGEDGLKKLRQYELDKLKAQGNNPPPAGDGKDNTPPPPPPASGNTREIDKETWRENLRRRTG